MWCSPLTRDRPAPTEVATFPDAAREHPYYRPMMTERRRAWPNVATQVAARSTAPTTAPAARAPEPTRSPTQATRSGVDSYSIRRLLRHDVTSRKAGRGVSQLSLDAEGEFPEQADLRSCSGESGVAIEYAESTDAGSVGSLDRGASREVHLRRRQRGSTMTGLWRHRKTPEGNFLLKRAEDVYRCEISESLPIRFLRVLHGVNFPETLSRTIASPACDRLFIK